ncbi:YncE family protein, partial [Pseudomonas sp. RIT-To-2]|uniref:YncE family protein n=1 Tax=Pseudomonas sp. RIT-To-2 TaxID=3462541 RepID=UPI0024135305
QPITLARLQALKDGSTLTLEMKVAFGGNANETVTFAVRTYTVTVGLAGQPAFDNPPYVIAPRGRLKDILLSLSNSAGAAVPGAEITLTLPAGTTYADGTGGTRTFTTDAQGRVTVGGVKGGSAPGSYDLVANSGGFSASATLTIRRLAGVGTIGGFTRAAHIAVSADGQYAYVTDGNLSTSRGDLVVVSLLTNSITARIPLGDNSAVANVVLSPDGRYAYTTCSYPAKINVIDIEKRAIVTTIPLTITPAQLIISSDGKRLYSDMFKTSNTRYAYAVVADVHLGTQIATYSVDIGIIAGMGYQGFALSNDGLRLYLAQPNNKIYVFNTLTHQQTVTIEGVLCSAMAISPDDKYAYCAEDRADYIVDLTSNQRTTTISHGFTTSANGALFTPDGTTVYYSTYTTVFKADLRGGIPTIIIQNNPRAIAVSPDGSYLYIVSESGVTVMNAV